MTEHKMTPHLYRVKIILEFLAMVLRKKEPATLSNLCWYVDYKDRSDPTLEEITQALAQRPEIGVERQSDGAVIIKIGQTGQTLTAQDLQYAMNENQQKFLKPKT